jgi:hypothetical protein
MALTQAELVNILDDLGAGLISTEEAGRRAGLMETEPGKYNCGTCEFFKAGECWVPGKPPRTENAYSVRCGDYVGRRNEGLPVQVARTGSRMFK